MAQRPRSWHQQDRLHLVGAKTFKLTPTRWVTPGAETSRFLIYKSVSDGSGPLSEPEHMKNDLCAITMFVMTKREGAFIILKATSRQMDSENNSTFSSYLLSTNLVCTCLLFCFVLFSLLFWKLPWLLKISLKSTQLWFAPSENGHMFRHKRPIFFKNVVFLAVCNVETRDVTWEPNC